MDINKISSLVNEALLENESLFLIDLSVSLDNKIKVTVDGDNGVSLKECIRISRNVEHNLDREEEDFSLEVMSVGATTPLQQARQYIKNVGRSLEVKTKEGEKIEGTLDEANSDNITLSWKAREPKPVGKGKVTVQKTKTLSYNEIVQAKVMIKF